MKTEQSIALDPRGIVAPNTVSQRKTQPFNWRARAALVAVERLLHKLPKGRLTLGLPDGSRRVFVGQTLQAGPDASLEIRDLRALRRLLSGGDLGFAESYIDGDWDSPDLLALLELALVNTDALDSALRGSRVKQLLNRVWHRLRDNSRRGSRRNISYHYDLGNRFYAQWLDPSMTYSSGLFDRADMSMAASQQRKYQRLYELAGLERGDDVLEIGCGWGGFMQHAAGQGCRVDGLTLSREQLRYANERMQHAGLDRQAAAQLTDYRDSQGEYDAVVSIEMLEAVGEARWPDYFRTLYQRLKPGAAAVVQVITIAEERFDHYRNNTDFIQRHVFPGGMLPTPSRLDSHAREAGLQPDHAERFGLSYARTLVEWREAFEQSWPQLREQGFDERFRRLWNYYLVYCEAGFRRGVTDVGIYRFRRPA